MRVVRYPQWVVTAEEHLPRLLNSSSAGYLHLDLTIPMPNAIVILKGLSADGGESWQLYSFFVLLRASASYICQPTAQMN